MAKKSSTKPNTALSMEKRKELLLTPCKTKAELKNWIIYHTGFDMPDHTVSRSADTDPLDAIWQIYDICVNRNNPEKSEELLYVAGRDSGKTLGVAMAEFTPITSPRILIRAPPLLPGLIAASV